MDESMVVKWGTDELPPDGKHALVLVDWYTRLNRPTKWGPKDFLHLVWQYDPEEVGRTPVLMDNGQKEMLPPCIFPRYTANFRFKCDEEGNYIDANGNKLQPDTPWPKGVDRKPDNPSDYEKRVVVGMKPPHEKANLHKACKGLFGNDLGRAFSEGLDFEKLVGVKKQAQGIIEYSTDDKGKTWANLISLSPGVQGQAVEPDGYVRAKDKRPTDDDSEVPF